jgi:hypothetical protein
MLGVAAEIGLEDPSGADGQEVLVDYGIEPEISIRDQRLDRARKVVAANGLDAGPGRRVAEEGKPFRAQSRPGTAWSGPRFFGLRAGVNRLKKWS